MAADTKQGGSLRERCDRQQNEIDTLRARVALIEAALTGAAGALLTVTGRGSP
jgi:hypothetical protein